MIRVLIAEDMHLIRGALTSLLGLEPDMQVVAELGRGDEVVAAALRTSPDVAVLDIGLPGIDGLTAAEQLHAALPSCRTLVLTGLTRPGNLLRALKAGVRGFIPKDAPADMLASGIRRVAAGERVIDSDLIGAALETGASPLSPRETDVLREAENGTSTDEIGARLALAPATVRNYLSNAISKTGARNRIDAIRIARDAGWLLSRPLGRLLAVPAAAAPPRSARSSCGSAGDRAARARPPSQEAREREPARPGGGGPASPGATPDQTGSQARIQETRRPTRPPAAVRR